MAVKRKKENPVPPWIIALVLLVCAGGGLFFLPSKRTLLDRQVRDNRAKEALVTLEKISDREKRRDPFFYFLTELRLKEQGLGEGNSSTRDELIVKACRGAVEYDFHPDLLSILNRLTQKHPNVERALELVRPWLPQFPSKAQETIIEGFVAGLLAQGRSKAAAELYADFTGRITVTEKRVMESVRLWRLAGETTRALETATTFLATASPESNPVIARLQIELLRETGRAEDAFTATRALYDKTPLDGRKELYSLLVITAQQVNRTGEIIHEVEADANAHPANFEKWVNYRELATAAGKLDHALRAARKVAALQSDSREHLLRLAQICEWSDLPNEAFDVYAAALKLRSGEAVDRLLALAPSLSREWETAELLNEQPSLVREKNLELSVAQLNEASGNFDQADRWYAAVIQRAPEHFEAHKSYGQFLLGLFEYDRAVQVLEKAIKRTPGDPAATAALAEALYRNGDYERAHKLLEEAVLTNGNDRLLEQLLGLSESLQRVDSLVAALKKKVTGPNASSTDLRRLATAYQQTGRGAELVETLKSGILRYPNDPDLKLRLATFYLDRKDYLEGAKVLEGSDLVKTSIPAMQLYVELLIQSQKFIEADAFFRTYVPANARESESFLNLQAGIAEGLERNREAEAIYSKLLLLKPGNVFYAMNYARFLADAGKSKESMAILERFRTKPTPETMRLMAQVLATMGRLKEAEEWQMRYLRSAPADLAQAYGFLGDVRLSRGDKINARRAYEKGLETLLKAGTQPGQLTDVSRKSPANRIP